MAILDSLEDVDQDKFLTLLAEVINKLMQGRFDGEFPKLTEDEGHAIESLDRAVYGEKK